MEERVLMESILSLVTVLPVILESCVRLILMTALQTLARMEERVLTESILSLVTVLPATLEHAPLWSL